MRAWRRDVVESGRPFRPPGRCRYGV